MTTTIPLDLGLTPAEFEGLRARAQAAHSDVTDFMRQALGLSSPPPPTVTPPVPPAPPGERAPAPHAGGTPSSFGDAAGLALEDAFVASVSGMGHAGVWEGPPGSSLQTESEKQVARDKLAVMERQIAQEALAEEAAEKALVESARTRGRVSLEVVAPVPGLMRSPMGAGGTAHATQDPPPAAAVMRTPTLHPCVYLTREYTHQHFNAMNSQGMCTNPSEAGRVCMRPGNSAHDCHAFRPVRVHRPG